MLSNRRGQGRASQRHGLGRIVSLRCAIICLGFLLVYMWYTNTGNADYYYSSAYEDMMQLGNNEAQVPKQQPAQAQAIGSQISNVQNPPQQQLPQQVVQQQAVQQQQQVVQQQAVVSNVLLSDSQSVICGAHRAATCEECPQGNGAAWCNGECSWCEDTMSCKETVRMHECPGCASHTQHECASIGAKCAWCEGMGECLPKQAHCAEVGAWKAPDPEPWFVPPDPIDKYGLTISVILPCGMENDFFERTIRSIHATTPPEILHEIIVVDDNSYPPLEPSFTLDKNEYKVKFLRSNVTLGLIDAKHTGALAATGDVLVMLDCHVKTALGYWEPFVREIADNPKRVLVPSITSLHVNTWEEYARPAGNKGGFSQCYFTLDGAFKWMKDNNPWVPIMSGGLLAIGREWFFQLGGHDQNMKGWGGENLDLSFRIWRCGGEIVSAPQSYIAHMWRVEDKPNTKARYKPAGNDALRNRVIAVKGHWSALFEQKMVTFPEFHAFKGTQMNVDSISKSMEALQCKDMNYYFDFFSYIYRDWGHIPKQVFQLTPNGGEDCLQLVSSTKRQWSYDFGIKMVKDEVELAPCVQVPSGQIPTTGFQYWHPSNPNAEGKCCSGLRVWNTEQCLTGPKSTYQCQPDLTQPAILRPDGAIQLGANGQCVNLSKSLILGRNVLHLGSCDDEVTKWEQLRPFVPPEFSMLSPELQAKW